MRYYNLIKVTVASFILGTVTVNAFADWGVYPNCNAPGTPIEVHSWWQEPGEHHPRHIHLATCLPHARDTTGKLVSFSGSRSYPVRVMAFNNPGRLTFIRNGWQESLSKTLLTYIGTDLSCQDQPDELAECTWWNNLIIDADDAVNSGLQELRMTPNVKYEDLDARQFATLNYQIYVKNARPQDNYRNHPAPIGRSWYTDFDYVDVSVNYMDFFTNLNQTIPTVKGIVPLEVVHNKGEFNVTSYLFLNPDFHAHPHSHDNPAADPTGKTKLLYKKSGRFRGTYDWDTRGLPNGTHVLYFQTEDKGPAGIHAVALKLLFNVQN